MSFIINVFTKNPDLREEKAFFFMFEGTKTFEHSDRFSYLKNIRKTKKYDENES